MSKLIPGVNDLKTLHPEVSAIWNYELNDGLFPENFTCHSGKKVWWKCKYGHEWEATIAHIVDGRKCPVCSHQNRSSRVSKAKCIPGKTDISTIHPELLKEWDYAKNITISPNELSYGSAKKVWWKCNKGHEWESSPGSRHRGSSCPFCSGHRILVGFNDLATKNPRLSTEWKYTKNHGITPYEVSEKSGKKVWWTCPICSTEYQATIANRSNGSSCPNCQSEYKTSFPEQALFYYLSEAFPDTINRCTDEIGIELDIYIPSIKTAIEYDGYHWHKSKYDHDLEKNKLCSKNNIRLIRIREKELSSLDNCICIFRDDNYTYHSLNNVIHSVFDTLGITEFEIDTEKDSLEILNKYVKTIQTKSFLNTNFEASLEWHPTKNGKLTPDSVSSHSNKKVWWICSRCGNEYQATLNNRSNGSSCKVCKYKEQSQLLKSARVKKGVNDLKTLRPKIAKEWDQELNGTKKPDMYTIHSAERIWWKCKTCKAVWKTAIYNRTNGHGCPKCAGRNRVIVNVDTGETYNSLVEASRATGVTTTNISRVLKGRGKTAGGIHWRYED